MIRVAETMSLKDFYSGNYGAKKKWNIAKKNIKKYAPVAIRVSIVIGSAIVFSQFVDMHVSFAAGTDGVGVDTVNPDGQVKNFIDGKVYSRILKAFEPVIFLVKAISYPIATLVALGGGLYIMVGNKEKGFGLIQQAAIGYLIVQMIPLLMKLLVEIAKSI
jgi:hypothetical protein